MEYRVRDMLACKYMADKIWEVFTWNISWMIEKWFFVELPNTIEWFIPFGMTGLEFNLEKMCVVQIATQKEFHFWDEIQVQLSQVDMSKMRLEFELV
jgi:exoribonuclease R